MLDVPKRVLAAARGETNATRRMAAGRLLTLLAIGLAPIALQPVNAESYPERTIKIVVPFPPGGPTDVVARLIAQSLSSDSDRTLSLRILPVPGEGSAPKRPPARNRMATRCCWAEPTSTPCWGRSTRILGLIPPI